jgi:hypothetical protein
MRVLLLRIEFEKGMQQACGNKETPARLRYRPAIVPKELRFPAVKLVARAEECSDDVGRASGKTRNDETTPEMVRL